MNSTTYTQEEMALQNGRHAWLYLVSTPINDIQVVQYEEPGFEIKTRLFYSDYDKALAYYKRICKKMVDGKI